MDSRPEYLDDDADLEIIDLDATEEDEYRPVTPAKERFLQWQRSLSKKRIRLSTTLVTLVLVLLVLLFNLHTTLSLLSSARSTIARLIPAAPRIAENVPVPRKISPSLVISTRKDGFTCIAAQTWSPDDTFVAVTGYKNDCDFGRATYKQTQLAIYNVRTGKIVRLISTGDTLLHAVQAKYPATLGVPLVSPNNLLWSPDGKRLALIFSVQLVDPISFGAPSSGPTGEGILLMDTNGKNMQVLLQQPASLSPSVNIVYTEWDVQSGKVLESKAHDFQNNTDFLNYASAPVAARYTWGNNGTIHAIGQYSSRIPTSSFTSGSIGNPDGDASFTLWQNGSVGRIRYADDSHTLYTPGVYCFGTSFSAWSPDGRYLIDGFSLIGRLALHGKPLPDAHTLQGFHMDKLSVLPVRDAALQSAALAFSPGDTSSFSQLPIAWSPNGRMLSTSQSLSQTEQSINVYLCNTGYVIATLLLPKNTTRKSVTSQSQYPGPLTMNWSNDNTHVLSVYVLSEDIMIWQVPVH